MKSKFLNVRVEAPTVDEAIGAANAMGLWLYQELRVFKKEYNPNKPDAPEAIFIFGRFYRNPEDEPEHFIPMVLKDEHGNPLNIPTPPVASENASQRQAIPAKLLAAPSYGSTLDYGGEFSEGIDFGSDDEYADDEYDDEE